jgi:DNA polymerase I-like protein with 3'-5' exonuclease and polymerase domains
MISIHTKEGYDLLHQASIAFAEMECNGIRIDREHFVKMEKILKQKIEDAKEELYKTKEWKAWRKTYGKTANLASKPQLGHVLFDVLKLKGSGKKTHTGRYTADEETLEGMNLPFCHEYLKMTKHEKALSTYVHGTMRELAYHKGKDEWRLHPFFDLYKVKSYRSSSSGPNFQNQPVRNPETAEMIRKGYLADKGFVFAEIDYSGIEVSMAACHHKDPTMIKYLTDPTKDMHGDMGEQLFCLKKGDMSPKDFKKVIRYGAKNKFIFAQFYGDFYKQCCVHLWDWAMKNGDVAVGKTTLKKHLEKLFPNGRGECSMPKRVEGEENAFVEPEEGTYEKHVQEVENDFWNKRFKVYGKWKRDWYQQYKEKGYFDSKTGFRYHGVFRRNEVINWAVQGDAAHCLWWSIIQISKRLRKEKMKSFLCGQIHDSLVCNIHKSEMKKFVRIATEIMTKELRKHYPWIIVPFNVEMEMAPDNGTWFHKRVVTLKGNEWIVADKEGNKHTFQTNKELLDFTRLKPQYNNAN